MEHLISTHPGAEELARLVDETPDAGTRAHLEACTACRAELEALRQQTAALRGMPVLRPPVEDWDVLEARLVSEGLVRRPPRGFSRLAVTPTWMRAAAAVLLFLSGTAVGAGVTHTRAASQGASERLAAMAEGVRTSEDAAEWVRATEQTYVDALLLRQQIWEQEGGMAPSTDPANRYAALEALITAGQLAVRQAPADPFLNGFLASAMAERQAVLRHISSQPGNWY